MKSDQWEESKNVEDQRGIGKKAGMAVGGGSLIILLIALFTGLDPQKLAQLIPQGQVQPGAGQDQDGPARPADPEQERQASFTKRVFRGTELVWTDLFKRGGQRYQEPVLHLFTGSVSSACGSADSAVGPFYCPGDSRVYIDISFYQDMQKKLKAPGDFARAYVVAHEVGHHVQRLLGYSRLVDEARRTKSKTEANHMSVRLELQADYLAGVWAHHAQKEFNFLERGDIESALNAAHQIGDDYLQKQGRGHVVPDSFTHGTSEQRMRWFKAGFETGDVNKAKQLFELPYDRL